MNITEQIILEQFPHWAQPLGKAQLQPGVRCVVVGCGTSYYIAQSVAAFLNHQGQAAIAVAGSEWLQHSSSYLPSGSKVQVMALSRSGESTETVAAAHHSRQQGHWVLGVTCEPGSSLVKASDVALELHTHPQEGIVMTASASLMLLAGIHLAGLELPHNLGASAQQTLLAVEPKLSGLAKGRKHFVFLGASELYGLANEGALKCQEMSLSYVQAYHPMEYRHGPVSLIEPGVLVTLLYHPNQLAAEAALVRELQAKGATVLGLGGPGDVSVDLGGSVAERALHSLPILQLLGERIAQAKGLDSTAPRHLTKVVTLS